MNKKIFFGIFVVALLLFAFPAFADERTRFVAQKDVKSADAKSMNEGKAVNAGKERAVYNVRALNTAKPVAVTRAEKEIEVKTAKLDAVDVRKEAVETMQNEKEELKETKEELKKQIKEAPKEEKNELREKAKEEIKDEATRIKDEKQIKFDEAKAKVETVAKAAKERLESAKVEQTKAKEQINAVKEKVKDCKSSETDECKTVRKDVKQKTKTFVSAAIDRVLGLLQKTKENLVKSKLSEEAKQVHLSEIDAQIQNVVDLKGKEAQLTETSSADEIKQINSLLAGSWKETQNTIRKSAGTIAAEKLGGVLQTSEKLEQRLATILSKLKEKGVDVVKAEGKIAEFNKLIGEAKSFQTEAKQLFLSKEPQKTDELMKLATEKIRVSQQKLNEAHKILKEILNLLKSEKEGQKALEESTTDDKAEPAQLVSSRQSFGDKNEVKTTGVAQ